MNSKFKNIFSACFMALYLCSYAFSTSVSSGVSSSVVYIGKICPGINLLKEFVVILVSKDFSDSQFEAFHKSVVKYCRVHKISKVKLWNDFLLEIDNMIVFLNKAKSEHLNMITKDVVSKLLTSACSAIPSLFSYLMDHAMDGLAASMGQEVLVEGSKTHLDTEDLLENKTSDAYAVVLSLMDVWKAISSQKYTDYKAYVDKLTKLKVRIKEIA